MLLEAEGWDVIGEAPNGESALDAVRALKPDLVLLDVQLPGIDGFEVTRRLRANGDAPAVILVSSRDCRDYGTLSEESGALGFVAKGELSGAALEALLT
jgi:DNA-binding response OmpR family regulator